MHRRHMLSCLAAASVLLPASFSKAATTREITWDDLIPIDVPYGEITGDFDPYGPEGARLPPYDENAYKFVEDLNGERIKLPGYIIPFDYGEHGVTSFILAPYIGACIHVPPPPANQLIFVNTETPFADAGLFEAVWVTGILQVSLQETELAEIGYELSAEHIEIYEW